MSTPLTSYRDLVFAALAIAKEADNPIAKKLFLTTVRDAWKDQNFDGYVTRLVSEYEAFAAGESVRVQPRENGAIDIAAMLTVILANYSKAEPVVQEMVPSLCSLFLAMLQAESGLNHEAFLDLTGLSVFKDAAEKQLKEEGNAHE
jgi:hypothetical protein